MCYIVSEWNCMCDIMSEIVCVKVSELVFIKVSEIFLLSKLE